MHVVACPSCEHKFKSKTKSGACPQCRSQYQQCPSCASFVPGAAAKCKHCNAALGFPHPLHLFMTCFTCGLWAPIWFISYLGRSK